MPQERTLIVDFLKNHKYVVTALLMIGLLNSIVTVLISLSLGKYYEIVFGHHSNRGKILDYFQIPFKNSFWYFIAMFFVLMVLRTLLIFLKNIFPELWVKYFRKILEINCFYINYQPLWKNMKKNQLANICCDIVGIYLAFKIY